VSSYAARASSAPRQTRVPRASAVGIAGVGGTAALAVGVALVLAALAFIATGGLQLERTTYVEIALMLGGAAVAAAGVLLPRRTAGPLYGGATLVAFVALAGFTAWSLTWSLAPSDSWLETNRTFAYLATLAAGVALVRLAPWGWAGLLHGVALACVIVSGWAVLTKVFPGALAADEVYARLRQPFDYWNSVGLMAALGVPPLMWLAARRSGHAAVNALAWPGIALLLVCIMLSYSRGALLALAVGVAFWLIVVPLRLRGALALLGATIVAAPVVAWAFAQAGLTTDRADIVARAQAGHELGALLVLMTVALLAAGLAATFLTARTPRSRRARRLTGAGLLAALALVPVVGLIALASAPGGIDGQVSKAWHQLTDPTVGTPANTPNRLTATSSVRARYWDEALKIYRQDKLKGAGAGAYATARTRYRTAPLSVRHAHGYVVQTLADLGLVGLALSLAALAFWLVAAVRAIGLWGRDRALPWDAERVGLATLATVVLVFGVHSFIDWTWFVPANACTALLCAGWVAGRGPLRARMAADEARLEAPVVQAAPRARARAVLGRLRPPSDAGLAGALRGVAAVAVLVVAVAAAWAAFQPVRSVHAEDALFNRLDRNELGAAANIAQISSDRNPLAVDPLFELAYVETLRNRPQAALLALERAVRLQPANATTWRRLGHLRLSTLNQPDAALRDFRAAYYLDPQSPLSQSDFIDAQRAVSAHKQEQARKQQQKSKDSKKKRR
jgi:tetratricopeptide (TPR) repeat protein